MKYPDADKHFWANMTKSVKRIGGYCLIPFNNEVATGNMISSQVIGIIEELLIMY